MKATVSLDSLWQLVQSLSDDNKKWLANKLMEGLNKREEKQLKPYSMEELLEMVDESQAEIEAGEGISSEEAHRRMKQFMAAL